MHGGGLTAATLSRREADRRLSSRSACLLALCLAVGCGKATRNQSVAERIMVIIPRGATYYRPRFPRVAGRDQEPRLVQPLTRECAGCRPT